MYVDKATFEVAGSSFASLRLYLEAPDVGKHWQLTGGNSLKCGYAKYVCGDPCVGSLNLGFKVFRERYFYYFIYLLHLYATDLRVQD